MLRKQKSIWRDRAGSQGVGFFRARALPGASLDGRAPHPPVSPGVLRPSSPHGAASPPARVAGFVGLASPSLRAIGRDSPLLGTKLTRTPDTNPLQPSRHAHSSACESLVISELAEGGWGLVPRVEFAMPATAGPLPRSLRMGGGGSASRAGAMNSLARRRRQSPFASISL